MNLRIDQVDAFASKLFTGNPAAVVVTEAVLDTALMQAIAMENNLAETAFVSGQPGHQYIRWFTPTVEVDLCGHATMAAAHVLFQMGIADNDVTFDSHSGPLSVKKDGDVLWLDFPSDMPVEITEEKAAIEAALGVEVVSIHKGKFDFLARLKDEATLKSVTPDFPAVAALDCRGLQISAPGDEVDFVSRFFAPGCGVPEDPVTGSMHTVLIPYWADQLNKTKMIGRQLSPRGGEVLCELKDGRVLMGGHAITYLTGEIFV